MAAIGRMPEVEVVTSCGQLPFEYPSGNNVSYPIDGEMTELFNMADFYRTDPAFLSTLEIPIVAGKGFIIGESRKDEVLVSESFAERR